MLPLLVALLGILITVIAFHRLSLVTKERISRTTRSHLQSILSITELYSTLSDYVSNGNQLKSTCCWSQKVLHSNSFANRVKSSCSSAVKLQQYRKQSFFFLAASATQSTALLQGILICSLILLSIMRTCILLDSSYHNV